MWISVLSLDIQPFLANACLFLDVNWHEWSHPTKSYIPKLVASPLGYLWVRGKRPNFQQTLRVNETRTVNHFWQPYDKDTIRSSSSNITYPFGAITSLSYITYFRIISPFNPFLCTKICVVSENWKKSREKITFANIYLNL